MRTFFKLALLLTLTCTSLGCAHNYYNIPQETLEKKVKVIGVAPFFTDAESDLKHPDKGSLVALIETYNAKNEKEFIARLRGTGTFYSVRQVEGDPVRLFSSLLSSREKRDDAGVVYNKYFYKKEELKQLITENGLDAILLVTVNGLTRQGKVYSSNLLSYLETDYNYLAMSAQLLDRDGSIIWEFPNFRRTPLSYPLFFSLQYPDFDEAAANLSEKVDVKFKTITGITTAFGQTEKSSVDNGPPVSTLYANQFSELLSLLKKYQPLFGGKKETPSVAPAGALTPATPAAAPAPAAVPAAPAKPMAPVLTPAPAAPPAPAVAPAPAPEALRPPGAIISEDIIPEAPPVKGK
jgi:hypothetical protein